MNEAMREKTVCDAAYKYTANSVDLHGTIKIPSVEACMNALLLLEPMEFWGDKQDLTEWAIFARDEILDVRNYIASKGRGLHDEPVDPAWCYQ